MFAYCAMRTRGAMAVALPVPMPSMNLLAYIIARLPFENVYFS
jgi:hypothetical protein